MSVEAVTCPACGSATRSEPDEHGVRTCQYCAAQFRVPEAPAPPTPPEPAAAPRRWGTWLTFIVLGAALGLGLLWVTDGEPEDPPPSQLRRYVLQDPEIADPVERTRVEVPAPAPPPSPEATFTFHSRFESSERDVLHLLGRVQNTGELVIDDVRVHVTLVDADGTSVGEAEDRLVRGLLFPGETAPIDIDVADPPEFSDFRFTTEASRASRPRDRVPGLEVTETRMAKEGELEAQVFGKVINHGDAPVENIRVEVEAVDETGALLGFESTSTTANRLAPGAKTRFHVPSIEYASPPARHEYWVGGDLVR